MRTVGFRLAGTALALALAAGISARPASAALSNGVYFAMPGESWPVGAPQTRRVDVRWTAAGPMMKITYDCGSAAPCLTPEVLVAHLPSMPPNEYVTTAPLGAGAPAAYFLFVYFPAAPCLPPGPTLSSDIWVGVWTDGVHEDISTCTIKGVSPPYGVHNRVPNVRNGPQIQLPPMHVFPRLTPIPPPQPFPGRKPA